MRGDAAALSELLQGDTEKDSRVDLTKSIAWTDSDGAEWQSPPIFVGIDYGHTECVMVLLDAGASPNLQDANDYTPAQWAAWKGFVEILRLLIERGARIDQQTLDLAQEEGGGATPEVMNLIRQHMDPYADLNGDKDEIMMKACREGDTQKVKSMLADGYDYSKWKAEDGKYQFFSPMNMAVKRGHIEIIQLFMEEGVQVQLGEGETTGIESISTSTEEPPSKQITEEEFKQMAEKMAEKMTAEMAIEANAEEASGDLPEHPSP